MVWDGNKTYKSLKKKGFQDSSTKSDDHKYLEFFQNGKLVLYTKLSHGSKKDIGAYLIAQMASQCKLPKHDFLDLVNCPLSKEKYLEKLKEQEII